MDSRKREKTKKKVPPLKAKDEFWRSFARDKVLSENAPASVVCPLQWHLDDMERAAKRLAEELVGAFSGSNPPGLRALWMEDHIRALARLELQFKAFEYAREHLGARQKPDPRG